MTATGKKAALEIGKIWIEICDKHEIDSTDVQKKSILMSAACHVGKSHAVW